MSEIIKRHEELALYFLSAEDIKKVCKRLIQIMDVAREVLKVRELNRIRFEQIANNEMGKSSIESYSVDNSNNRSCGSVCIKYKNSV